MSKYIPITFNDGSRFTLDNVHEPEILGYHIVHNQTGRILPSTTRKEIYTKAAAIKKMNRVAAAYTIMCDQLDIWEYEIVPLYEGEIEDYTLITDVNDHLFNK